MEKPVIVVKNLNKTFYANQSSSIREKFFSNIFKKNRNKKLVVALRNINFEVRKGEFFGIIGRNGSGKSTLLNILMGSIKPDEGAIVKTSGKMIRLALGMGFDPNLSARDNIYINGSILGLTFKEIGFFFDEIVQFAELTEFVDVAVKNFSSGMMSKLKFSIAIHAKADVFLMDEFFGGVGDVSFKEKSTKVFQNTFLDGRTILHVNHNLQLIKKHCTRVLVLDKGEQLFCGGVKEGIEVYNKLNKSKSISKIKLIDKEIPKESKSVSKEELLLRKQRRLQSEQRRLQREKRNQRKLQQKKINQNPNKPQKEKTVGEKKKQKLRNKQTKEAKQKGKNRQSKRTNSKQERTIKKQEKSNRKRKNNVQNKQTKPSNKLKQKPESPNKPPK